MIQRYFTEHYRFLPPYRGNLVCRLARGFIPGHLRDGLGIRRWHFEGLQNLRESLDEKAGIILSANHCRWADPVVLAALGLELNCYFYYLVSYHLLKQSRMQTWRIRGLGGYSVWREGLDRESIRFSANALANAERPLVIFPEGTWFRQNDRLGPLQEGMTLMLRQAAKIDDRPLRLHPVSIKYWFLDDPRPALHERLGRLETRLGWQPQEQLEIVPRVEKLGRALLAIKEVEHFGQPQPGSIDKRVQGLAESWTGTLEKFYLHRGFDGPILDRIRRLRHFLAARLIAVAADPEAAASVRPALDTLLFCENLNAHSWAYLDNHPSLERLTETVERIEETVLDEAEKPVAPLGAVVAVGAALDGRTTDSGTVGRLALEMQGGLDRLLSQGPPPDWNCPKTIVPSRLAI